MYSWCFWISVDVHIRCGRARLGFPARSLDVHIRHLTGGFGRLWMSADPALEGFGRFVDILGYIDKISLFNFVFV